MMGDRADFYVGTGTKAKWLGSIAWNGYPQGEGAFSANLGVSKEIIDAVSEFDFISAVTEMLASRDDATKPFHGWPWPWPDSTTTDFAYCFGEGRVQVFSFGKPFKLGADRPVDESGPKARFPDMRGRQNITFGKRSGLSKNAFFIAVGKLAIARQKFLRMRAAFDQPIRRVDEMIERASVTNDVSEADVERLIAESLAVIEKISEA